MTDHEPSVLLSIHHVTRHNVRVSDSGVIALGDARVYPEGAEGDERIEELEGVALRLLAEARRIRRDRADDRFAAEMWAAADATRCGDVWEGVHDGHWGTTAGVPWRHECREPKGHDGPHMAGGSSWANTEADRTDAAS